MNHYLPPPMCSKCGSMACEEFTQLQGTVSGIRCLICRHEKITRQPEPKLESRVFKLDGNTRATFATRVS